MSKETTLRFDGPSQYHDWLKRQRQNVFHTARMWGPTSTLGQSFGGAMRSLIYGANPDVIEKSNKIIERVQESVPSIGLPTFTSTVCGFMPNVPAVIAGTPNSMFTRDMSEIEGYNAPLRIFIETSTSGGITDEDYKQLGISILAFALYMQTIRPIELTLVTAGSKYSYSHGNISTVITVKIPTNPLDLSTAAFMLTDISWDRRLAFTAFNAMTGINDGVVGWPFDSIPGNRVYEAAMKKAIGAEPNDLYFTGTHLSNTKATYDPVGWVKDMIDTHIRRREET